MAAIPMRTLGRTGLEVTVLGFGAMELRGTTHWRGRPLESSEAERILNGVLDAGINYIDTSIDYGESEERIGTFISHRRDEYFLASKCGCLAGASQPVAEGQRPPHVFTKENIVAGVNQSLERLRTDHLDLVQFHASPSKATLDEEGAIDTLLDLQREGKVRFLGSSSTLPNISDHIKMGVFDAFQIPYSALQREHSDAISSAARAGAGTIIRGGVARGVPGEGQGAQDIWNAWNDADLDDLLDGESQTAFMLRYTLSHPDLHTTIVGTLNRVHLDENVKIAMKGPLAPEVYAKATERLETLGKESLP